MEYAPVVLFTILVTSAAIKLYTLAQLKYKTSYTELFFRSFFPYSKAVIKNATHNSLKDYYRKNNKLNSVLYFPFITILFLYVLMNIVG